MSREKFLQKRQQAKEMKAAALEGAPMATFARIARRGAGWEVLAVDLPEDMASTIQRTAAEFDLYPNIERKLLIEARKTDFEKWK
jgi:hypothetical protein